MNRQELTTAIIEANSIPEPNSGCWLWLGSTRNNGYGSLTCAGVSRAAHRASWIAHNGPIPGGLCVCHKCDVRSCVNPTHLFLGTYDDNLKDMSRKGRHWMQVNPEAGRLHGLRNPPPRVSGSKNGFSKINEVIAVQIREMRARGHSYREIGAKFGISDGAAGQVIRRVTWRHVP